MRLTRTAPSSAYPHGLEVSTDAQGAMYIGGTRALGGVTMADSLSNRLTALNEVWPRMPTMSEAEIVKEVKRIWNRLNARDKAPFREGDILHSRRSDYGLDYATKAALEHERRTIEAMHQHEHAKRAALKRNPSIVDGFTLPFRHAGKGLKALKRVVQQRVPFELPNPRKAFNRATEIQSLLLDRYVFTLPRAKAWARDHGFFYGEVDAKPHTWRMRQGDPAAFKAATFRTITLTDGVQAVIGVPKRSSL